VNKDGKPFIFTSKNAWNPFVEAFLGSLWLLQGQYRACPTNKKGGLYEPPY